MKKFDYISILAGGACLFNCPFCVGRDVRKEKSPHISNKFKAFIECFSDMTDTISISGSTSDPYFLQVETHDELVTASKKQNLRVNLHTRQIEHTPKLVDICDMYDGVVFSIDENFLDRVNDNLVNFRKLNYTKNVRFSIVITKENSHIFDRKWLDAVYNITGVSSFTFRPDVFDDSYCVDDFMNVMKFNSFEQKDNGSCWFEYEGDYVTYWDNKIISQNVRYLWSDGNISSDCEWKKLC